MNGRKIKTPFGTYIGSENAHGVISFKGIPYATPPTGDLRWKAPQKQKEREIEIKCFDFGFSCIQPVDEVELASVRPQSEDCLTLNIWTKNIDSGKKPVMVFIHGGGYIGGGSSDPVYNGEVFPERNHVIFVTINYRCNVLGFMDLEELGGEDYQDSKNLGLLDQICALKWIQKNIHLFGGDPDNVTIFGESAGSGSVSLLMTMPGAKGLFHKVIAQSGALIMHKSMQKAKEYARDFCRCVGTNSISELVSFSQDEIRDACIRLMKEYGYKSEIMFAPVADGKHLPLEPFEAIKSGCAKGIKLMVGTTAEELNYWKYYYPDFEDVIKPFLEAQFDVMEADLDKYHNEFARFFSLKKELPPGLQYLDLSVELMFRIPSIKLAELQSQHADTWMYLFAWQSKNEGLGACHAVDLPFVFHVLDSPSGISFTGENPPELLADQMQDAWVSFARSGDPSHEGIPEWPKYGASDRQTMIINEEWNVEEDPRKEERLILRTVFE